MICYFLKLRGIWPFFPVNRLISVNKQDGKLIEAYYDIELIVSTLIKYSALCLLLIKILEIFNKVKF
jgi:hypothetical protein